MVEQAIEIKDNCGSYGDEAWSTPTNLGAIDNVLYIENNSFIFGSPEIYTPQGAIDPAESSRIVFRYNIVENSYIISHGTGQSSDKFRGMRQWEIYGNTFTMNRSSPWYTAMHIRGGTGVIFDNIIDGNYMTGIKLDVTRWGTLRPYWGQCDDTIANGWCSDSRTTPCDSDSNCTGAATCETIDNVDGDGFGYPCRDQIGRGIDMGVTTSQASEPAYFWNNSFIGSPMYVTTPNPTAIMEGRDYYNNLKKPGYVPYPYPHPLTLT